LPAADIDSGGIDADFRLLRQAVREGGARALSFYKGEFRSWTKGANDPVTEADLEVNDLLRNRLQGARPDYGWLSEETEDDKSRLRAQRYWIIDPIDGTRAFAKGKPHFAISAALVSSGVPILGIVFNPATDEFFEARRGHGAWLNGREIRVGKRRDIEGCRMAAHPPMFKHKVWPTPWPPMEFIERNSVAYRIVLVACGSADAVLALSAKNDWDLAAAHLILEEAGGRFTAHDGSEIRYDGPSIRQQSLLGANPVLHAKLMERTAILRLPPL